MSHQIIAQSGSVIIAQSGNIIIAQTGDVAAAAITESGPMRIIRPVVITDAMFTDSNVPENDYAAYVAGTTYAVGNRVIVVATHKIYESLAAGNIGNYPPTDILLTVPKWLEVDATNRWKVFDLKVGTQTVQATSITYQITPGVQIDSIAFLNLDAVSARAVFTDPVEGIIYDNTIDLLRTTVTGTGEVIDWYTYFFSSFSKISDVVMFDLPPYINAVLDLTVTYAGGTAKAGTIVIGLKTTLGIMQRDPKIGITDYSTKTVDVFGNYSVLLRGFSKKMSCVLMIPKTSVDDVNNVLASYRGQLLVWVGSELYSSLLIYGKYNDYNITLSDPGVPQCTLEIEGLSQN